MERSVTLANITCKQMKTMIEGKLRRHFGKEADTATLDQIYKATALVIMDIMTENYMKTEEQIEKEKERQVHYLSLEFLMGRLLEKNAFNLGVLKVMDKALRELNVEPSDLFEVENDPALGNGGLGRLAACYLEAMTTLEIPATCYSICYEYGLFRQKIVDGSQVELPDNWKETGSIWLRENMDEVQEVRFGGRVEENWDSGRMKCTLHDYDTVIAVPMDLPVAGYQTDHCNVLRLWDAKSPVPIDMNAFSRGDYMKAIEQNAMAQAITKVLYPEDNHREGKSLRLKQQYFFVSATVQSIVKNHLKEYHTLKNFHKKHVLHINDTHPTLVIPELMRIFLDAAGMSWEEAWRIVTKSVAYTNHTVLAEALERWPQDLIQQLLPRIFQIICEINNRYLDDLRAFFGADDINRLSKMAIVWDGEVRMANLCVCACFAINGVSALHSEILKNDVFHDAYLRTKGKFTNVTNGIDHRRWLAQINPKLHELISSCISDSYLKDASEMERLLKFKDDKAVLKQLEKIKHENKVRMSNLILRENGIQVDPDSIFDVQAKRLHEYKRQLLNVMHILTLANRLHDNPNLDIVPRTFIFGAKAAPGYYMAKQIIRLINSVSEMVNKDPILSKKIKVVFLENYRVSLAEVLMPASELSEQISTAGKEASGTGNMKFMTNGALTIGTMDGANVEICNLVSQDNMFIFGMSAEETANIYSTGNYNPIAIYDRNPDVRRVLDHIRTGVGGKAYPEIAASLLIGQGSMADPYLLLGDYESYIRCQEQAAQKYLDREAWNKSSLINIAKSGFFAADRSISEYAENIWKVDYAIKNHEKSSN